MLFHVGSVAKFVEKKAPSNFEFAFRFLESLDQLPMELLAEHEKKPLHDRVLNALVAGFAPNTIGTSAAMPLHQVAQYGFEISSMKEAKSLAEAFCQICEWDTAQGVRLESVMMAGITTIQPHQLCHVWLPFVGHVLDWTTRKPLHPDISLSTLAFGIIMEIRKRYIGPCPSNAPPNFVFKPLSCFCLECQTISSLLINPEKIVGRFRLSHGKRRHVHQRVDAEGVDCTHTTDRSSYPGDVLVVTKRNPQDLATVNWQRRCLESLIMMRTMLNGAQLQGLLGTNRFDQINKGWEVHPVNVQIWEGAALSHVANPPAAAPPARLGPGAGLGAKRKADVIDLTGDD